VGASYGDDVLLHMSRLLAEGTGAESAAVWSRSGDTLRCVAQWPAADGAPACVVRRGELPSLPGAGYQAAVKHQGELLGALALSKRRGEGLSPFEEKLVNDLAHQAALILRNTTLAADLRAHVEELRESRQRLVRAQDEERRRLERNLHDGAQQNLVALKVKLSLAESMLAKDPVAAKRKLGELKSDADEALETLRDLARGIYPPLLAEQGLRAAMEAQARRAAVPVTVEAGGLSRHAQDVEAAVYFCVLEALQNAQKHAHTPTVTVRLSESDGRLRFSVRDEGRGFDAGSAHGSGLQNMRDRVDALGGRLEVVSAAGAGTEVRGALPVEPARSARVESVAGGGLPGLEQAVGTEL
jgi:signal transduction histidine kinase